MLFLFHESLHVLRVYFLQVGNTSVRQNFRLKERATYIPYCHGLCNCISPENQSHVLELQWLKEWNLLYVCYPVQYRPFRNLFYPMFSGNWLSYNGVPILISYVPVNRRIDLKILLIPNSSVGVVTVWQLCAVCALSFTLFHCVVGFGMFLLLVIDTCFEFVDGRELCSNSSVIN